MEVVHPGSDDGVGRQIDVLSSLVWVEDVLVENDGSEVVHVMEQLAHPHPANVGGVLQLGLEADDAFHWLLTQSGFSTNNLPLNYLQWEFLHVLSYLSSFLVEGLLWLVPTSLTGI